MMKTRSGKSFALSTPRKRQRRSAPVDAESAIKAASAALMSATAAVSARAALAEAARDSLAAQVVILSNKNAKLEVQLQEARESDESALFDQGVEVGMNNLRFNRPSESYHYSNGMDDPEEVAPNHICGNARTLLLNCVTRDPVEYGSYEQSFYIKGGGSVLTGLVSEDQINHALISPHSEYVSRSGKYSHIPKGQLAMVGISPSNSGTALSFKIDMNAKTAHLYVTDEARPGKLKEAHIWHGIPGKVFIAISAKRGDTTPGTIPREVMALPYTHHRLVPYVVVSDD